MDLLVEVIYFLRFKEHILKLLVLLHVNILEPVIFRSVVFLSIQYFEVFLLKLNVVCPYRNGHAWTVYSVILFMNFKLICLL